MRNKKKSYSVPQADVTVVLEVRQSIDRLVTWNSNCANNKKPWVLSFIDISKSTLSKTGHSQKRIW